MLGVRRKQTDVVAKALELTESDVSGSARVFKKPGKILQEYWLSRNWN